jgi:hypothetical protein
MPAGTGREYGTTGVMALRIFSGDEDGRIV